MSTAELKVINSVLKNKDIHTILGEEKEVFGPYQDIVNSIQDYYARYKNVPDIKLIQERFPDLDYVETHAPTDHYLSELKKQFLDSRLDQILLKAAEAKEKDAPEKVLEKLQTSLAKLGKYTTTVRDLNIKDYEYAEEYFEKLRDRAKDNDGTPGIPTGFKSIDSAYTTGMAPGHSIVVMGYTGRGKSMWATNLACKAWAQGYKPLILSLEMSPEEQMERAYAMMGSGLFNISDLARGDVDPDVFRSFAKKKLQDASDFIVVSNQGVSDVTPNIVQAKIDTHRPDIVILDYLQLMKDNAKTQQMTPRMLNLSREIKMLAVSNNIPIVSITAVTDEDGDKRDSPPLLSQVSWSSGIEYDANLVVAVHRHDDTDIVELVGRKNRHGDLFNFGFQVDFDKGIWNEKFDLF